MTASLPRREDRIGLILALGAHIALAAWLALHQPVPMPLPPPERITVTLTDEAGLTSTAPDPAADAAPDQAPNSGEAAPAPSPLPAQSPAPAPVSTPRLQPLARPAPAPVGRPVTQPVAAAARPAAVKPRPAPRPDPIAAMVTQTPPRQLPSSSAAPSTQARSARSAPSTGGSRFADAFAKGVPGATGRQQAATPAAAAIGPAVRSSLAGAISRQLKPRWIAPQGADADKLVTILTWTLNPDGSLASEPRVVRQEGITDANRPQAQRHAEQAIRAVRLAAPFDLPEQYFSAWKHVSDFRFDRKLSQ